ncbi:MAG TPA: histidine kinase [Nonomuraea sp.]|nr:histidine kinase [Nonomuraea sp.]
MSCDDTGRPRDDTGRLRGGAGVMRGPVARFRGATRLDKARWLIVISTDFILLLTAIGYVELFIRWRMGAPWPVCAAGAVLLLAFNALSTRPFRVAVRDGRRPTAILAVSGTLALVMAVLPILPFAGPAALPHVWPMPVWLALFALVARKRVVIVLAAGSILLPALYLAVVSEFDVRAMVLPLVQFVFTVVAVGAVWANLRLWRLAHEAYEGEEALARLAVSEERLRFARDLNDLLGQSLADVATRTGRAEELLRADPAAAAAEMFEVRDLARRSLREVRTVVQNYRAIDLDEVLASVRAVLEAADVRCVVRADTDALPPEIRTLLAAVVREGATNVLKHSKAERCTITIEGGVLEMANDGVTGPVGRPAPDGLGGLAERVRAAGGTLEAAPTDEGRYLLRAAVPA